ncbi:MAG: hypothetical protein KF824_03995 [Fimbriimonadaceae bacterium]|nr:MAG: hypothetical protein KF824_03995 [Fimbriimonadaceae bacterium]
MQPKHHSSQLSIWSVLFITLAAIILFLMFMPVGYSHTGAYKTVLLSKLRQINTSASIYCSDFDGLYPAASGMPAVRVVMNPYIKNSNLFEPASRYSPPAQFNFNLAGVSEKLPPYPGTTQTNPESVAVFYAPFWGETRGVAAVFVDGHHKFFREERWNEFAPSLSGQFDRKGVKLWPADYLQAQDPLK